MSGISLSKNAAKMKYEELREAFYKRNARGAIRTHEFLRKWVLSPSPLTWLGNPRTNVLILCKTSTKKEEI